jgi:hypothetical protein
MCKPAVDPREQAGIQLYADIMTEVKHRTFIIWRAAQGELSFLPAPAITELCYLQLRMCCELIAMACLVAHEDIEATRPLRKLWTADEIMQRLGRLHDDFYPRPMTQTLVAPKTVALEPLQDDFLTKDQLIRLVGECGSNLHRGSLRNLISGKAALRVDLTEVNEYARKMGALLSVHYLSRLDGVTQFHCVMKATDMNDQVSVTLTRKNAPPAILLN